MRFSVRVFLRDVNGEDASSGINIEGVNTIAGVDAFTLQFASVLEGLSSARASKGEAATKFAPSTPQLVKGTSSSYTRFILLCRNGPAYASFTVPAPKDLPYIPAGPYAGIKVDPSTVAGTPELAALVALLANTVTPTGAPFPTAQATGALMKAL